MAPNTKMEAQRKKFSCETASDTVEWITQIIEFIKPYRFFFDTHVVNFFKDRLWEAVDKDWIDCLQNEPVENLLQIPSGVVQDHWPVSLKNFILTSSSLAFPREQVDLEQIFPGECAAPLDAVLTQGMNLKKKHEVRILASVVSSVARSVGAQTVVDVGSGQGYLSQVLSFQYEIPVVAIDASSHHGVVTNARAERIKKHYAGKMHKSGVGRGNLNLPKTVTCHVLSSNALRNVTACHKNHEMREKECQMKHLDTKAHDGLDLEEQHMSHNSVAEDSKTFLVLAGLHACGDLSVTMLRSFSECEEVKAVVSVGCCYNLLSEDVCKTGDSSCGYPLSNGVKKFGSFLGKSARDLACQSAERWKDLRKDAGVQNFDLHAFRAAFQMILDRYYPEVLLTSPSIGRQGKALRRRHQTRHPAFQVDESSKLDSHCSSDGAPFYSITSGTSSFDKYNLFKKFSKSALLRLGLELQGDIDLSGVWKEFESVLGLVGPYWSLRASMGPVLETLVLLDRLLFLQEQGSLFEEKRSMFQTIEQTPTVEIHTNYQAFTWFSRSAANCYQFLGNYFVVRD